MDKPTTLPTPSELLEQCLEKIRDLQTEVCALRDQHAAEFECLQKDVSQLKQTNATLAAGFAKLEGGKDYLDARCGFLERTGTSGNTTPCMSVRPVPCSFVTFPYRNSASLGKK